MIATPVYNYDVPAPLKAWVDHTVCKGLMLGFDGKGLVTDRKATVLIASDGVSTKAVDMGETTMKDFMVRLKPAIETAAARGQCCQGVRSMLSTVSSKRVRA